MRPHDTHTSFARTFARGQDDVVLMDPVLVPNGGLILEACPLSTAMQCGGNETPPASPFVLPGNDDTLFN